MHLVKFILASVFLVMLGCGKKSICDNGPLEDQVKCLRSLPQEKHYGFSQLKQQNKIYYSITSSPERLRNLHHVLNTLDLSVPEKVFIVLPVHYKNEELYNPSDIENISCYSEKIEILRPKNDLGPIMKLIPAVERVRAEPGDNAYKVVVTFDDDTGYPAGLPEQLIKYSVEYKTIVAGSAHNAGFWDIKNFPGTNSSCEKSGISECDVVEGFHGIAYPVEFINTEKMKIFSELPGCKLADDMVISYVLAVSGVKRILIKNQYTNNLLQFGYGYGKDAAHKIYTNNDKYQKCFASMKAY